jgi:hypothetical protein
MTQKIKKHKKYLYKTKNSTTKKQIIKNYHVDFLLCKKQISLTTKKQKSHHF